MTAGLSADAIAHVLGTRVPTVRTQLRGVLRKLGVHSQVEAISLAFRRDWKPRSEARRGDAPEQPAARSADRRPGAATKGLRGSSASAELISRRPSSVLDGRAPMGIDDIASARYTA